MNELMKIVLAVFLCNKYLQEGLQGRISLYRFFSRFSGAFPTRQLSEGVRCPNAYSEKDTYVILFE